MTKRLSTGHPVIISSHYNAFVLIQLSCQFPEKYIDYDIFPIFAFRHPGGHVNINLAHVEKKILAQLGSYLLAGFLGTTARYSVSFIFGPWVLLWHQPVVLLSQATSFDAMLQ